MFGMKRESSTEPTGFLKARWFRALVTFCCVLLVVAVCFEVYRRAVNYGTEVVQARPVEARIVMQNPPAWLHREIVRKLLDEAYAYVQKDEATCNRARNILDSDVLQQIANVYTGADVVAGKTISRQSKGFNAWVKRITKVQRNISKDESSQIIEIYAEWRAPYAWVKANGGSGDMLYLIDADGTRLPGDYPVSDRNATKLMVITGVDLTSGGKPMIPAPGERWVAVAGDPPGDDLLAAMKLVDTLKGERFVGQIDAIDMTNFNGRKDARSAWIVMPTVWKTADGTQTVVWWGRPVGAESFYEVHAPTKINVLNELFLKFNRIDAGCAYIDIRDETLRVPNLASQADSSEAAARSHG
jgi:hypothetical protein